MVYASAVVSGSGPALSANKGPRRSTEARPIGKTLHRPVPRLPGPTTSRGGASSLASSLASPLGEIVVLVFSAALSLNVYTARIAPSGEAILALEIRFWLQAAIAKAIRDGVQRPLLAVVGQETAVYTARQTRPRHDVAAAVVCAVSVVAGPLGLVVEDVRRPGPNASRPLRPDEAGIGKAEVGIRPPPQRLSRGIASSEGPGPPIGHRHETAGRLPARPALILILSGPASVPVFGHTGRRPSSLSLGCPSSKRPSSRLARPGPGAQGLSSAAQVPTSLATHITRRSASSTGARILGRGPSQTRHDVAN